MRYCAQKAARLKKSGQNYLKNRQLPFSIPYSNSTAYREVPGYPRIALEVKQQIIWWIGPDRRAIGIRSSFLHHRYGVLRHCAQIAVASLSKCQIPPLQALSSHHAHRLAPKYLLRTAKL